jgi:hypothetical protein
VSVKRQLYGQIRGLLRPFGIKISSRSGAKGFDEEVRVACQKEDILYAAVSALLDGLCGIVGQIAALDGRLRDLVRRSEACWHLTSVPGVGPVTALAFVATVEDPQRFKQGRSIGSYVGLTPRRYQSGERDITTSISRQGGCHVAPLSLRGGQLPADDGATAFGAAQLGPQADEAGRGQEGAHGSRPQAGGAASRTLEAGRTLRSQTGMRKVHTR